MFTFEKHHHFHALESRAAGVLIMELLATSQRICRVRESLPDPKTHNLLSAASVSS